MIVHLTDVLHVTKFLTEWLYEKTVLPTYKKKKIGNIYEFWDMRKLRMNRSNCLLNKLKVATHCLAEELQGVKNVQLGKL